jgi:hypothetical protein
MSFSIHDHANAISTVLKMGFKGRAARNEYLYLLNKIMETKRQKGVQLSELTDEEFEQHIQRRRLLKSRAKYADDK